MALVLRDLDGLVGAGGRVVDSGELHVVAVAALIGDGKDATVDEEMSSFGEALEGAGDGVGLVIGDDLEGGADRRLEAAEQGGVEDGAAEVDGAVDDHLVIVGDQSGAEGGGCAFAELYREAGGGTEGKVAGGEDTGAGAGGERPATIDLGGADGPVAAERGAAFDHRRRIGDRAVDLEEAGGDGGGALEVGIVAANDQRAVAGLGEDAVAGDGVVVGDRLAIAVGDGKRGGPSAVQEHHLAVGLAVCGPAGVIAAGAAGHRIGPREAAVDDGEGAAVADEDGAAERRPAAAVGAGAGATVAAETTDADAASDTAAAAATEAAAAGDAAIGYDAVGVGDARNGAAATGTEAATAAIRAGPESEGGAAAAAATTGLPGAAGGAAAAEIATGPAVLIGAAASATA